MKRSFLLFLFALGFGILGPNPASFAATTGGDKVLAAVRSGGWPQADASVNANTGITGTSFKLGVAPASKPAPDSFFAGQAKIGTALTASSESAAWFASSLAVGAFGYFLLRARRSSRA